MNDSVYDNGTYKVVKDDNPTVHNGENMNWLVINMEHNTEESNVATLCHAIALADYCKDSLQRVLTGQSIGQKLM